MMCLFFGEEKRKRFEIYNIIATNSVALCENTHLTRYNAAGASDELFHGTETFACADMS